MMRKILIMIVILVSVIASGQAQEKLKIGEVKNGKLVITNLDALKAFFFYSLGKSGTLGGDYKVSASPEGDRYFVYFPVTGNKDKVSNIGVLLVKINNDVYIVENQQKSEASEPGPGGGGSATVTCTGNPCNSCHPEITWPVGRWIPLIVCICEDPEGFCNMSITFSVNINIGF
jgi:hypothetical protein